MIWAIVSGVILFVLFVVLMVAKLFNEKQHTHDIEIAYKASTPPPRNDDQQQS